MDMETNVNEAKTITEEAAAMTGVLENQTLPLIPQELVEAGWTRQRSPTHDRYYYFNVKTNESKWDFADMTATPRTLTPPVTLDISTPQFNIVDSTSMNLPVVSTSTPAAAEVTPSVLNLADLTTLLESQPLLPTPPAAAPIQPTPPAVPPTVTGVGVPADSESRTGFYLGGKRFVVVKIFRGQVYINIREYYQPQDKAPGRLFAGKKGLNLTLSEWNALCGHMEGIQRSVTAITKH